MLRILTLTASGFTTRLTLRGRKLSGRAIWVQRKIRSCWIIIAGGNSGSWRRVGRRGWSLIGSGDPGGLRDETGIPFLAKQARNGAPDLGYPHRVPCPGLFLEQSCRATLPGFAFFLGDIFHVGDVGSGLGEDVVEIVAHADEGEAFFQKFADARGAEQEQAQDYVVLAGVFDQLFCGGVKFGRSVHVRELVLVIEAHRHAEIVLTEEEDVDAWNGGDLGDILNAGSGFDLQGDHAVVVEVAGVAEESGLVHTALRKVNRARADSRIFGATDGLARFFGGVDVGD